jgi:hypothetical protein
MVCAIAFCSNEATCWAQPDAWEWAPACEGHLEKVPATLVLLLDKAWCRIPWLRHLAKLWSGDSDSAAMFASTGIVHLHRDSGGAWALAPPLVELPAVLASALGLSGASARAPTRVQHVPKFPAIDAPAYLDSADGAVACNNKTPRNPVPAVLPGTAGGRKRGRESHDPPAPVAVVHDTRALDAAVVPIGRSHRGVPASARFGGALSEAVETRTAPQSARAFHIRVGASAADLGATLRAVSGAPLDTPYVVTVGKPVPTTGQYTGHCAFVSIVRSAGGPDRLARGSSGDAKAELAVVMLLRRGVVLSHIQVGRLQHTLAHTHKHTHTHTHIHTHTRTYALNFPIVA